MMYFEKYMNIENMRKACITSLRKLNDIKLHNLMYYILLPFSLYYREDSIIDEIIVLSKRFFVCPGLPLSLSSCFPSVVKRNHDEWL